MKIYYFSGAALPSQNSRSVHVMKMAQALAHAGHNVTLFARGVNNAASEDLFKIYDTEPCFKLHLSSSLPVPFIYEIKQFVELSQKMMHSARPSLLYGHDPVALSVFARSDIPIIFEIHEIPSQSLQSWAFNTVLKNRNLNAIVCVSDVLKQELLKLYPNFDPERIFVAHDGADLVQDLETRESEVTLRGRPDALNIGYAGSVTPGKGVELISRLAQIRPEYDFHIVGGGKKQVQYLETQNKQPNIYFYGHRDHADIPSYLRSFDICLAPYQHRALIKTGKNTSRWISPMKVFEYMAVRRPMICSKLQTIEEIVTHDVNALLVPATDEEKWAQAIDMLAENPDKAELMASNAYESLAAHYTWDKRVKAIFNFYEKSQGKDALRQKRA